MSAPAPHVAPWEDVVLRIIALYKLAKAIIFFAAGMGVRNLLHKNVGQFLTDYFTEHQIDPENRFLHETVDWALKHASDLTDHKIRFISYVAFFYAGIFLLEGIGLYLRKHWAEYMVLVSTGSLLPIEFWELHVSLAWWKFLVLFGNLLIVAYLVHRIRLDARVKAEQRDAVRGSVAGPGGKQPVAGSRVESGDAVSTKSR